MKLNRDIALKINWVFDQLVPPIIRDCRWFMAIPLRMAFRHKAPLYIRFKGEAHNLSHKEYVRYYEETSEVSFERETDLNRKSIALIQQHLQGNTLLEVGCGRGHLSRLLAEDQTRHITAVDIHINPTLLQNTPNLRYQEADIEDLPFADHSFSTVVCTHTLEHVLHLQKAIAELRRVAKRLIIVVPKQRPYRYTFDLHVNFFPYIESFLIRMQRRSHDVICLNADGDIFYVEDVKE